MESFRNQLPVSPEHWWRKFDEDDTQLLDVVGAYETLKDNPAWLHFSAHLFRLKDTFERAILQGEYDRNGKDITPELRSAYGMLLQILSIPAEAAGRKQMYEEQVMHYVEPQAE